jgi:hypothetical protein
LIRTASYGQCSTGSEGSKCRDQPKMMTGRVRAGNERSEPLNETRFRFRSFKMGAIPVLLENIPWSGVKNQMKLDLRIGTIGRLGKCRQKQSASREVEVREKSRAANPVWDRVRFPSSSAVYAARAAPLGAGDPCSRPCVLRSSSISGRWMPYWA